MYISYHKKWIIAVLIGLGGVCGLIFLFIHKWTPVLPDLGKIKLEQSGSTLSFGENQIKHLASYDYYQVEVFPLTYSVSCESKVEGICNSIPEKQDRLKTLLLATARKDLRTSKPGAVDLDLLGDEDAIHATLTEGLYTLFSPKKPHPKSQEYQKYFETPHELNQIEIDCVDGILMNSNSGPGEDLQSLIRGRVGLECTQYANLTPIQVGAPSVGDTQQDEVELGMQIKEVRLEYTFYLYQEGRFIEASKQSLDSPYEKNIQTVLHLKEL